jgi:predicted lipid-binding transport protein (Tim44 family)
LIGGVAFLLWRLFAARKAPESRPIQFAGIGSAASAPIVTPLVGDGEVQPAIEPRAAAPAALSAAEREPFLRVARTSFIRLQAANDAGDLDDIRDYTTPEMFAELSMQVQERGDAPQKTEVVMVNAQLVDDVVEGDYAIASVRFSGLIRENDAANPAPFDEIWHVRKNLKDRKGTWLISGIQQVEAA